MKKSPLNELGCWRELSTGGKELWLQSTCDRFFHDESFIIESMANRVIEIDGELINEPLDFFCLIGEMVNGAEGYFGQCFQSFDDCLFGGFGIEFPSTIVWKNFLATEKLLPNFCNDIVAAIQSVHERQS
ncbi:barstar family protein [Pseudoalteromonas luteoviolacea]|uniref:barstar family protein n=1 Tax=Pseudoalteromonas luteoviolacea TaxID=43657 RepID=UPI001B36BAD2|nr:barstar family protein [Pseudoalteromonas luteoviolacea]MBQ4834849.1 barstar family protein [Pseudoalteromonas luteoviolacea]